MRIARKKRADVHVERVACGVAGDIVYYFCPSCMERWHEVIR